MAKPVDHLGGDEYGGPLDLAKATSEIVVEGRVEAGIGRRAMFRLRGKGRTTPLALGVTGVVAGGAIASWGSAWAGMAVIVSVVLLVALHMYFQRSE
jgi:hypothetical protein